ncbi:MAG: right-handed parallel beta-helix repeat-containing protein [Candidatus Delongbacteria bacterium]|nr:right-handed parallel beta-helix repeat-containing protein [Candidatus Delongbacteria bacterium]MBN2836018.1 right-handed parallel beta-helix repeat-containing protein [Candidatus Delongbacteria bacterium]
MKRASLIITVLSIAIFFACNQKPYYLKDSIISQGYSALTEDFKVADNDKIKLIPGHYMISSGFKKNQFEDLENVTIDGKDVVVSGDGIDNLFYFKNCKKIVISNFLNIRNFKNPLVFENCSDIVINNSVISVNDGEIEQSSGITFISSNNIRIENCNFSGFSKNLNIMESNRVDVNESAFYGNGKDGSIIKESRDVSLIMNIFDNSETMIYFENSDFLRIEDNLFINAENSIKIKNNDKSVSKVGILRNDFNLINKSSIDIDNCDSVKISYNSFKGGHKAISISNVKESLVNFNRFNSFKAHALFIENYLVSSINENDFEYGNLAVGFRGEGTGVSWVEKNNFIGNSRDLHHDRIESIKLSDNSFYIKHGSRRFKNLTVKRHISDNLLEKIIRHRIESPNYKVIKAMNNKFTLLDTLSGVQNMLDPFKQIWTTAVDTKPEDLTGVTTCWLAESADVEKIEIDYDRTIKLQGDTSLKLSSKTDGEVILDYIPKRENFMEWNSYDFRKIKLWLRLNSEDKKGIKEISFVFNGTDGKQFIWKIDTSDLNLKQGEWILANKNLTENDKNLLPSKINSMNIHVLPESSKYDLWFEDIEF